jgi:hypothetical protein
VVGVSYSSYGWPKPFFTVTDGRLVGHNQPVPKIHEPDDDKFGLKSILGHSIMVDRVMMAFFNDFWFSSGESKFTRLDADEVEITCLLIERLKKQTDAAHVRLILYLQYGGGNITSGHPQAMQSIGVKKCAERLGVEVIDEFGVLKATYERSPDEFRSNYVRQPDGATGHKSSFGNLEVARRIKGFLTDQTKKR